MPGPIYRFLAEDHVRLEGLLQRAVVLSGEIDSQAYAEFRAGLLKHIAMEEKILLPAAQQARGGGALPAAAKLRLDHGALATLLVPTPTPVIVAAIRAVLAAHNPIEEAPGGVYDECDELLRDRVDEILGKLRSAPEVAVAPHVDGPNVTGAINRALARAGRNLKV
jgi:hypothetical protein